MLSGQIDLVNAPIPVLVASGSDVQVSVDSASPTFPFSNDRILQDQNDVRPYISLPDKFFLRRDGTGALVMLKLTQWEGKTALGVTWQHTLGEVRALPPLFCR